MSLSHHMFVCTQSSDFQAQVNFSWTRMILSDSSSLTMLKLLLSTLHQLTYLFQCVWITDGEEAMCVAGGDLLVSSLPCFTLFVRWDPVNNCWKEAVGHEGSQGLTEQADGHHQGQKEGARATKPAAPGAVPTNHGQRAVLTPPLATLQMQ